MKVDDLFVENKKEIGVLSTLKLPLTKSAEKLILSQDISKNTNYYSLIQLWRGKIIERTFATRLKKKKPEYQEVIRRIEGNGLILYRNMYFGTMCGYKVVWSDSKPSTYYWSWDDIDKWDWTLKKYFQVYPIPLYKVDDLKKVDNTLKYCAWNEDFQIIDYITIYRKYPEIEILSKLEYNRLLYNTTILNKLKDKKFKKFLCKNAIEDFSDKKYVSGQVVLKAYKENISILEAHEISNVFREFQHYGFKNKYPMLNILKTKKYIESQKIGLPYYMDLLQALEYLHLDLNDTKNSYPNDFKYWHDFYTKQMETIKNKSIDEGIEKAAAKFKKIAKSIDGISLLLPHSTQDLIIEGEKLNHCVGRMNYNKKIAEGKSLILFVRKEEKIEEPLVTMEYDPKQKKILQLYGYHDTQPEETIKDIIYNKWLPKIKRMRLA